LGAHSVGAPHIRQRLFWVADADEGQRGRLATGEGRERDRATAGRIEGNGIAQRRGPDGRMADTDGGQPRHGDLQPGGEHGFEPQDGGARERMALPESLEHDRSRDARRGRGEPANGSGLGDTGGAQAGRHPGAALGAQGEGEGQRIANGHHVGHGVVAASANGFWSRYDLIPCLDGKARRTPPEPAFQPLAYGVPNRVGLLRGAGNAIVPEAAAEFICAWLSHE
jgi:DNA (cytosine-5)-methyltransferase 1